MCRLIKAYGGAMQSSKVPHFNYHLANPLSMHFGCVEMNGRMIHKIANIDEFYHEFGFTPGMCMAGVLPEEFIWAEYIQNATGNFVVCLQIRIIKYLIKHSEKYGEQCKVWLDTYLKEVVAKAVACAECGMKPICERLKITA
ncbi:MAG TPA: hypothetical protein VLS47_00375 [Gallionella sp.]|nr:hypothetical protein [Gallionella sp.]